MPRHRLIAVLLVHQGRVVQTRRFKPSNMVGHPFTAVDFFNTWAVDEIAVLEISPDETHVGEFVGLVAELSRRCFVPLTVGGKIRDLDLVERYTRAGADKVVLNTHAVRNPALVEQVARSFGSQAVVVSIDARPNAAMPSGYETVISRATEATGLDAVEWAEQVVERGAGEIVVNAVEHDGDKRGYDLRFVRRVAERVPVPVVAMGGVGNWAHLVEGIRQGHADAVAAGNVFHYTEHSTKKAKEFMIVAGLDVRKPVFYKVDMPRRPKYKPH